MPIQLVVVDGRGPIPGAEFDALSDRLRERGVKVESMSDSERPAPWAIFGVMRAAGVYPPNAVMVAAASELEVAEAKNAGAWAVGVTDGIRPGESRDEAERERLRALFLGAGADAVVDSVAELADAVDAINGLM